ncbi:hypothetical protein FSARC_10990 [Fusarium sarcochroum]|uniref:Uncharacterized protein n=1 Tax=Fusarium sarcochroum TaxID=1208366 RepID=A0A8H4TIP1_9HYPO|nr:hypothetical protein FSARC_10990 [Fusarium sarcochroum]
MIRLYILFCLLPCLLLSFPSANAALLPRLKAPFKIPGLVLHEPEARSVKVTPFKELPQKSHHGRGLHDTIRVVKRLVEDQGDMVEVTEETLHELLDQINSLQEQVNGMLPSGASDRQPSRETGASSGGQSGQSPSGSSNESPGGDQADQLPAQAAQAESSNPDEVPGPSRAPVVSDPSLRSPLPAQANAASSDVEPQPSGASDLPDTPGQSQAAGQSDSQEIEAPAAQVINPTLTANDDSANVSSETQLEGLPGDRTAEASKESGDASENEAAIQPDGLSNNADAQPTGEQVQSPTEPRPGTAQETKPAEELQDGESDSQTIPQGAEEPSALPGGAFIESPDDVLQTLSSGAASVGETGSSAPEETQQPSQAVGLECVDEDDVSDLPIMRRNPNCTPGGSPSASEPAQDGTITLSPIPATETGLVQADVTASEIDTLQRTTELQTQSPETATIEEEDPAIEPQATSNPTIDVGASQQLAAPTLISSPGAVATRGPSALAQSLRTLVFTSTRTRSTTVKATSTRTDFVNANPPTQSFTAPGHVFKEDADATFGRDEEVGLLKDSDVEARTQETPSGGIALSTIATPVEITRLATPSFGLNRQSTLATPEPAQESLPRSPVISSPGDTDGAYDTTTASGFRTVPRPTASLAERA